MSRGHRVERVTPSSEELRQLSEHVAYEIRMLIGTATKLLVVERTKDWVDLRAQAESFLLHMRALYQFFYWKPKPEIPESIAPPVYPLDYVPDWVTPEDPGKVLETLSRDVSRRVMHITVERVVGQEYPVLDAARALLVVIRKFSDAKPPDFLADMGDLSPSWAPLPGFSYSGPRAVTTQSPPTGEYAVVGDVFPTPAAAKAGIPQHTVSVKDKKD
jgi:hypothetical protein